MTAAGTSSVRPAWSPDGQRVAFQSTQHGQYHVLTMAADGGNRDEISQGDVDAGTSAGTPVQDSVSPYFVALGGLAAAWAIVEGVRIARRRRRTHDG